MTQCDSAILDTLAALGTSIKSAGVKAAEAADAPTSHPVGDAPSGDQPAEEGEFSKTNESDSKETAGPQGIDSASDGAVNPVKKEENLANQEPLDPTSVDGAVPSEIDPKKTVQSGDSDSDTGELGGPGEATGEGEGNISGVGGPKFSEKSSAAIEACDDFLKGASAIVPVEDEGVEAPKKEADEDLIPKEDAEVLIEEEKQAEAQVNAALESLNILADASLETKQAALVRATAGEAQKHANGFVLSTDEWVFRAALDGTLEKQAQDDPSGALAASVPTGDAPVPPADPAAAAAGAPPAAGPEAGAGINPEEILMQVVQAVQAGEISPEEAIQLLGELGLPPEVLQAVQAQLGGAAAPAAAGGAPPVDPAAAAAGAPAGAGAEAPAEEAIAV